MGLAVRQDALPGSERIGAGRAQALAFLRIVVIADIGQDRRFAALKRSDAAIDFDVDFHSCGTVSGNVADTAPGGPGAVAGRYMLAIFDRFPRMRSR